MVDVFIWTLSAFFTSGQVYTAAPWRISAGGSWRRPTLNQSNAWGLDDDGRREDNMCTMITRIDPIGRTRLIQE